MAEPNLERMEPLVNSKLLCDEAMRMGERSARKEIESVREVLLLEEWETRERMISRHS